ncbi:MAG: hypothetical protein IPO56_16625 [Flavobacteriales bacterium]|nr:hypothetical protein [Flavobacteriales bacterium]
MGVIGNLIVALPPREEQEKLSSFLDSQTSRLDTLVTKVESAMERLQEYRTALISAAVTGEGEDSGNHSSTTNLTRTMGYKEDTFKDFARRTLANLRAVEAPRTAGADDVYEVTQLINSMLGLVTFPKEEDRVPDVDLHELVGKRSWPAPAELQGAGKVMGKGNGKSKTTLRAVVIALRHAVSHQLIEFRTGRKEGRVEIVGVRFWNNKHPWELTIGIGSLRKFVVSLAEEVIEGPDKIRKRNPRQVQIDR